MFPLYTLMESDILYLAGKSISQYYGLRSVHNFKNKIVIRLGYFVIILNTNFKIHEFHTKQDRETLWDRAVWTADATYVKSTEPK